MTTHDNAANIDMDAVRYRPLNFFKQPFSFGAPLCIAEETKVGNIYIMLIDIKSIKDLVQ